MINSIKDKSSKHHGGVYVVRCSTCTAIYIGETLRQLPIRIKEHQDACRLNHTKKSAIAKHYRKTNCLHDIDWENAKLIEMEDRTYLRKLYEHIYIIQSKSELMNPNAGMKLPAVWSKALPQLPTQ
jgi:GIY-YIG catalytic domain